MLGAASRPALFRILNDTNEEFLLRLSSAEALMKMNSAAMRGQAKALCLLLTSPTPKIPELQKAGSFALMAVIKNKDEDVSLRSFAIEALAHLLLSEQGEAEASMIFELAGILSSPSENRALRANLAFELVRIGEKCQGAKLKMVENALERAAQDEEDVVRGSAQHALELLCPPRRSEPIQDDSPTIPLPRNK
jgi:hypothetical protein